MNIHSLWVGPRMTALQWASMSSFVRTGHVLHLYTDDVTRPLPKGVVALPLPAFMPKRLWRFGPRANEACGSLALYADLMRAEHLYRYGGWWTDLDVISLKPFPDVPACGLGLGWQEPPGSERTNMAAVGVLGATPGNPGMDLLRKRIRYPWLGSPWESPVKRIYHAIRLWDTVFRPWNVWWSYSGGPPAITSIVRYLGIEDEVFPYDVFYPVPYPNWRDLLAEDLSQLKVDFSSTVAVHVWGELYRQEGIDVNRAVKASWMRVYLDDWRDQ